MGQKIQLTESQLRSLIKESVRKAVNEISSDMIGRASSKFHQRYGGTDFPGPDAKDFPKDEHGNLLYPKDMKPLADHYRKFNQAFNDAKRDENLSNPTVREAMEIWNDCQGDVDWEETDNFENEGSEVSGVLDVDGWHFEATGYASFHGDIEEIEEVYFESPDGEEGSFRP